MKTLKIIKIGGNVIDDTSMLNQFIKKFAKLPSPKILVHGGGKLATKLAEQLQIEVKMIEGRRITDADTLDIITMVYGGKINKNMVAGLQAQNCNSIGFSGADGNTIISEKRPVKPINYGFAGDIKKVNIETLKVLLNAQVTPVFCAITHDGKGQLLNTNADTVASELSIALASTYITELYYCFEKKGVLEDVSDNDSVIETIDTKVYQQLIQDGVISEGMLPKLKNCFYAIENKVKKVCIGSADMLFDTNAKYTTLLK